MMQSKSRSPRHPAARTSAVDDVATSFLRPRNPQFRSGLFRVRWIATLCVIASPLLTSSYTFGEIVLSTVPIGNAGNVGEPNFPSNSLHGAVAYAYQMGTFEVTAAQYAAFLNAVAQTDTYNLYNEQMWTIEHGSHIQRTGTAGNYTYAVAADWANRPANFLSWGDAARFANWMHNGQPTGPQGASTTERGSYRLDGLINDRDLRFVTRETGATWVIPSDDEWYKSAYHKNNGLTADYWVFPTGTNDIPSNQLSTPDPGNSANFFNITFPPIGDGYTIGSPYYRTEVGSFSNSPSPYGTFDQGGNVWEWTEERHPLPSIGTRARRGGGYEPSGLPPVGPVNLTSGTLDFPNLSAGIAFESSETGFRLALVPEPGTVVLVGLFGVFILRRRTRAKALVT